MICSKMLNLKLADLIIQNKNTLMDYLRFDEKRTIWHPPKEKRLAARSKIKNIIEIQWKICSKISILEKKHLYISIYRHYINWICNHIKNNHIKENSKIKYLLHFSRNKISFIYESKASFRLIVCLYFLFSS